MDASSGDASVFVDALQDVLEGEPPSCSWGPTRGLVFDEPAVGRTEGCRSVEVLYSENC